MATTSKTRKVYLGDGVYVAFDGVHIVLTTENGVSITNTIFLTPDIVDLLKAYLARLEAE